MQNSEISWKCMTKKTVNKWEMNLYGMASFADGFIFVIQLIGFVLWAIWYKESLSTIGIVVLMVLAVNSGQFLNHSLHS